MNPAIERPEAKAPNAPETAQQRFSRIYITSSEICERMEVSRPTVLNARKRGILPDEIEIGDGVVYIWERDTIEPYLSAWALSLAARRGELV